MTTLIGGTPMLYILSVILVPEKRQDVRQIFTDINREMSDREGATFIYKMKVIGENRVIAAVNVTHPCIIEAIMERLFLIAPIETRNEPVITFEDFGRGLGIPENLIAQATGTLKRENIIYMDTTIEPSGNTTEELFNVFKTAVVNYLRLKTAGEYFGQTYKNLAEKRIQSFANAPDPVEFDKVVSRLPLVSQFGSAVRKHMTGVQFLEDYVASRIYSSGY